MSLSKRDLYTVDDNVAVAAVKRLHRSIVEDFSFFQIIKLVLSGDITFSHYEHRGEKTEHLCSAYS